MPPSKSTAAVFVHGIFSNARVWNPLLQLLRQDPAIDAGVHLKTFEYPTPKLPVLKFEVRVPTLGEVAEALQTFLETEGDLRSCPRILLIGHSQGGLIIQRYIADELNKGRGRELERVRGVVLLATPNTGSQLLESLRRNLRALGFWRHPQEKSLLPYDREVEACRKTILQQSLYAASVGPSTCPIRFDAYAGLSDGVVPAYSARWVFPDAGTLEGDHSTILKPRDARAEVCEAVRSAIRRARHSFPPDLIMIETSGLDPSREQDLDAVMALEAEAFSPQAAIRKEDLRHWLQHYDETWRLRLALLTARVNDEVRGFLMFHESPDLIVVDYIAVDQDAPYHDVLSTRLRNQLARRSMELGNPDIVFEVEDPAHAGDRRQDALARIHLFCGWGARLIEGVMYLAPDMNDMTEADTEVPYRLMYARTGQLPQNLPKAQVIRIVDQLYNVWYRNWFSHRIDMKTLGPYLQRLCDRVAGGVGPVCDLTAVQ